MADGSFNAYLTITNKSSGGKIEGSCLTPGHKGCIEVISWQGLEFKQKMEAGLEMSMSDRKKKSAPKKPDGFSFTKNYDRSSDDLIRACWEHTKLCCEFELYRPLGDLEMAAENQFYISLKLDEAYISGYEISDNVDELPSEEISLKFKSIAILYKHAKLVDGKIELEKNSPIEYDWSQKKIQ